MAPPTKQQAKALADAYKRTAFDRTREQVLLSLDEDGSKDEKEAFIASVKDRTRRKMQSEAERGGPTRSEEDEVEMLLKELDRYPIIDNLVDKLIANPKLMDEIRDELASLLDKH